MIEYTSYLYDKKYPRLMRLNNPLGILISLKLYVGKQPKKDRTYECFDFYSNGILAGLQIIEHYYFENKANTIEKIINKYAKPGTELKPLYESISKGSGFKSRQVIPWRRESIYLIINELARALNKGRNPMIHPDLFAMCWLKLQE